MTRQPFSLRQISQRRLRPGQLQRTSLGLTDQDDAVWQPAGSFAALATPGYGWKLSLGPKQALQGCSEKHSAAPSPRLHPWPEIKDTVAFGS